MFLFSKVPGCEGSSLMRAFSQHVLHRMNVQQNGPLVKYLIARL